MCLTSVMSAETSSKKLHDTNNILRINKMINLFVNQLLRWYLFKIKHNNSGSSSSQNFLFFFLKKKV
jgi:hypothetical protein